MSYETAKELYTEEDFGLLGNLLYRLGWALIRQKKRIDEGISNLEKALELLPKHPDIKLKLASALVNEKSDYDRSSKLLD